MEVIGAPWRNCTSPTESVGRQSQGGREETWALDSVSCLALAAEKVSHMWKAMNPWKKKTLVKSKKKKRKKGEKSGENSSEEKGETHKHKECKRERSLFFRMNKNKREENQCFPERSVKGTSAFLLLSGSSDMQLVLFCSAHVSLFFLFFKCIYFYCLVANNNSTFLKTGHFTPPVHISLCEKGSVCSSTLTFSGRTALDFTPLQWRKRNY